MRILALILCALLLVGCSAAPAETTAPTTQPDATTQATEPVDLTAPDFTVYDAQGNPHKLSDFRGKPVVLNFWASWCPPCKAEMPDFEEAYQSRGEDIHFVMVNLTDGQSETVATASQFLAESGYTFPVYFDTQGQAATVYGIQSIPTTFFIDAEGKIVAAGSGKLDAASLWQGISLITGG